MQFTRIPPPFAPLGGPVGYTVENDTTAACDIRIIDPADGSLFGAKRFVSVRQAAFDAAPYLRSAVRFTPSAGPTGVYTATGRTVTAIVEATATRAGYSSVALDKRVPDGMSETEGTASGTAGSSGLEASGKNAIDGSTTGCQASDREPLDREPSEQDASGPEPLDGQTSDQHTFGQNTNSGSSTRWQASGREPLDGQSSEQDASGPEPLDGQSSGRNVSGQNAINGSSTGWEAYGKKTLVPEPSGQDASRTVTPSFGSEQSATAPARTFLPTAKPATAPTLLTTLPGVRLLPDGACEELTLLTAGAQNVTVIARSGDTTNAASYSVPEAGLHLFRIDARDFPGAETLTVDAGACGTIDYTLVAPPCGGVRLAWRSSAGSVEHYTFPTETEAIVETAKGRVYGPEGYVPTGESERRRTLHSAFEVRPVLEALAELTCSPAVWLVTAAGYEPVDVVSEDAVVHRHGTMCCMEITIRPAHKTPVPWS